MQIDISELKQGQKNLQFKVNTIETKVDNLQKDMVQVTAKVGNLQEYITKVKTMFATYGKILFSVIKNLTNYIFSEKSFKSFASSFKVRVLFECRLCY